MSSMSWKPKVPSRTMYARLCGSEAPVALLYSTFARGSTFCSASTALPVCVGSPGHKSQANYPSDQNCATFLSLPAVNMCLTCTHVPQRAGVRT